MLFLEYYDKLNFALKYYDTIKLSRWKEVVFAKCSGCFRYIAVIVSVAAARTNNRQRKGLRKSRRI